MQENHGRGFAGMNPQRQREIASMGGRAAHESGRAHEWSSAEARQAGHLGGIAARHHRQANGGKKAESVETPQNGENLEEARAEEHMSEAPGHAGATPPTQQSAGSDVETTRKASDDLKARTWDVGSSDDEEVRKPRAERA